MNVYFVNCMLACMLAYIAGYYMAYRKFMRIISQFAQQVRSDLVVNLNKSSVTSSDSRLH